MLSSPQWFEWTVPEVLGTDGLSLRKVPCGCTLCAWRPSPAAAMLKWLFLAQKQTGTSNICTYLYVHLSTYIYIIVKMKSVTPKLNQERKPTHQAAVFSTGILSQSMAFHKHENDPGRRRMCLQASYGRFHPQTFKSPLILSCTGSSQKLPDDRWPVLWTDAPNECLMAQVNPRQEWQD